MSADPATLRRRLIEALAMEPGQPFTPATAKDAIKAAMLEQVVCARVEGKVKTFRQFYELVWPMVGQERQR